jgi:HK97 family phage portal protein
VLTHGNAFAKINWSKRGQVEGLEPLHPKSVIVEKLQSGRLRYRVTAFKGQAHSYLQNEMLHIRYRLAPDGYMGLSPITVARATFGLALEQQSQATAQASKGFRPEGTLVFPNPIGVDGKADALDALAAKASDTTSKGGILVLDGGVEWHPLSFSSRDAEFLESRKLSDLAIARIFGVPPTSIGVTDHATYSNVFGENQALVSRCLSPMAKRVEQAMCAALLPKESRRTLFIEHDLKGLIRGDIETRYNSYAAARQWGFMTTNEIRALENLPRVEGGDALLSPLNMADQKGTKDGPMESD